MSGSPFSFSEAPQQVTLGMSGRDIRNSMAMKNLADSRQSSTNQTCSDDTNGSRSTASMYNDDYMDMNVSVCTNSKTTSIA